MPSVNRGSAAEPTPIPEPYEGAHLLSDPTVPIPRHIAGSTSKEDESVSNFLISDLEELLQLDLPEPRKENQRSMMRFFREYGYPTPGYLAWANWGRSGTIKTTEYNKMIGNDFKRESVRHIVAYVCKSASQPFVGPPKVSAFG